MVGVVDGQVRRMRNAFDAIQSGQTLADVTRSVPDAYKTPGQSQTRPDSTGVHTWAHGPGLPDLQVEERGGGVVAKTNYLGERVVVPTE